MMLLLVLFIRLVLFEFVGLFLLVIDLISFVGGWLAYAVV